MTGYRTQDTLLKQMTVDIYLGRRVDLIQLELTIADRYPQEMRILSIMGVAPGQALDIVNPYLPGSPVNGEYFGNVGEHCVAVAEAARVICETFFGRDQTLTDKVVRRALVHDATKRHEAMRRDALKAMRRDVSDAYLPSAYDSIREVLLKEGFDEEIVEYLATAGQETGHNSLERFIRLEEDRVVLKTDDVAAMVVHLADDSTASPYPGGSYTDTFYVTPGERMDIGDFTHRYPMMHTRGLGFDRYGKVIHVIDLENPGDGISHVRPYAYWQEWVSARISDYLVERSVGNSTELIKNLLNAVLT